MDELDCFIKGCQNKVPEIIKNLKNRKIVIWGAGKGGKIAKKVLLKNGLVPFCYVDHKVDVQGEYFFSRLKVFSPKILNPEEYYVVVGVLSKNTTIPNELREKNMKNMM